MNQFDIVIESDEDIDHDFSELECTESKLDLFITLDLIFRMFYSILQLSNFVIKSLKNDTYYNDSEKRIILFSVVFVLIGIQNCSITFYPWIKNIRIIFYSTVIVLIVFTALRDTRTLLFIEKKNSDVFYRFSEFFFYFILLPNLCSLFIFIICIFLIIFFFMLATLLQRLGFNVRVNIPGMQNLQNDLIPRAQIFRQRYFDSLKGQFYHKNKATEQKSLIDINYIKSDEYEKIEKALSCNMNQQRKIDLKKELIMSEEICSICFTQFNELSYILKLPGCQHTYHFNCIIAWLEQNPSCPCCRFDLLEFFEKENNQIKRLNF